MEILFLLVLILAILLFPLYRYVNKRVNPTGVFSEESIPIGNWNIYRDESFLVPCNGDIITQVDAIIIYDDVGIPSFCSARFPFTGLRFKIQANGICLYRSNTCALACTRYQSDVVSRGLLVVLSKGRR